MLLGFLTLCIVVIRAFPKTATALWLSEVLVGKPLAWLSSLKRRDVIFLTVMIALFLTGGEFVAVFGVGELFVVGVNLSLYFDALLVTSAVALAAAIATSWRSARAWVSTGRQRRRTRSRNRARKTRRPGSPDDEDAPGWLMAKAL